MADCSGLPPQDHRKDTNAVTIHTLNFLISSLLSEQTDPRCAGGYYHRWCEAASIVNSRAAASALSKNARGIDARRATRGREGRDRGNGDERKGGGEKRRHIEGCDAVEELLQVTRHQKRDQSTRAETGADQPSQLAEHHSSH